ncbi:MAG TPA: cysteine--tRNA ligase, partial [Cyclobacteriaceae bacterium]|nr:cysteine--tRNA ligase [Cyclobacteriaceae bacterium]
MNALGTLRELGHPGGNSKVNEALVADLDRLVGECYQSMGDDFNTAKTLAVLFEMAARINDFKSGNQHLGTVGQNAFDHFKDTYIAFVQDVLGLKEENAQDE